jgi:outer membrane translocation and assembly module TamA
VLGLSWRGGVIIPTGSTDIIPLQERFFNGGENTVRSFKQDELGPVDSLGNELGGEAFNVVTVELRQRLRGRFDGALFWDAGNLESDFEDFFHLGNVRHALGFGLRYLLPVGPVRLDVGFNPDPRAGEADVVTHFSVGMSF